MDVSLSRIALRSLAFLLFVLSPQLHVQAAEPEVLTQEQIMSEIIGNTVTGVQDGTPYTEYYEPDGIVRGRWTKNYYLGKWTVSGSEMCFDFPGINYDGCWTMSLDGDVITYYKQGKLVGTEP